MISLPRQMMIAIIAGFIGALIYFLLSLGAAILIVS